MLKSGLGDYTQFRCTSNFVLGSVHYLAAGSQHDDRGMGVGFDVTGLDEGIQIIYVYIIRWETGRRKGKSQEMDWRLPWSEDLCLTSIFLCRFGRRRNRW